MEDAKQKAAQIMKGVKTSEQEARPQGKVQPVKNIEEDLVTQLANLSIGLKEQYSQSEKLQEQQKEYGEKTDGVLTTLLEVKKELIELASDINKRLITVDEQVAELTAQGKVNQESLQKYKEAGDKLSKQWAGDNAELIKSSNKMFDNIYFYTVIMIVIVFVGYCLCWRFWAKPEFNALKDRLKAIEIILEQKNNPIDKPATEEDKVPAKAAHKR